MEAEHPDHATGAAEALGVTMHADGRGPEGRYVDALGLRYHLLEFGEGPPTVFLHGGGPGCTGWTDFGPCTPHFAAHRRVILVDLLQYGRSDKPAISGPMWDFALADHYTRRNPHVAAPDPRVQVSVTPGAAPVFPISRTVARFNNPHSANHFTSACSAVVYRDELFGPVVTTYVYDEGDWDGTLDLIDRTAPYGLTGAVFADDRAAIQEAKDRLRYAAGNFYVNDKPTGAVVGQQPFGGSRASGTNDKAGAAQNLLRWTSTRSIGARVETFPGWSARPRSRERS